MNTYLVSFGETLRKIRKKLSLTQNNVSELSGINIETIRRIEGGKVIPKFETLDLLSSIYKTDLNTLFLKYRVYNYSYFYEIKNRLETKFDANDFDTMNNELKELNTLLNYIHNIYYKNLITQLSLITEAAILYNDKGDDSNEVFDKLIKAMKITNPKFNLSNYKSLVYSSMEIRILMNISSVLYLSDNKEKHREMMEFCFKAADSNDEVYPKICWNLARICVKDKDFEKALEFSSAGIKACQKSRNLNNLDVLYYVKGVAEYILNKKEYIESFNTSIILCEAFGHDKLKNIIMNDYEDISDIEKIF